MRILAAVLAMVGCGDDGQTCGPGSASPTGLTMTASIGADFEFSGLREGADDDCQPGSGSSIISVTIESAPGSATALALCIPKPEDFGSALAVGNLEQPTPPAVILVTLSASTATGCFYNLAPTTPVSGTARAVGLCDDGAGSAGFALVIDVSTSLTGSGSDCAASTEVELVGSAAVAPHL
jgi:hypothetical protein